MPNQSAEVDVIVVGGGIAGLWLHATLRAFGCRSLLLEARALGSGQTAHSQGIIHGGTKYTLSGRLTRASEKIAEMPKIWRAALRGEGEIDLSGARMLAEHQFLCSSNDLGSRFAALAASKLLRGRVEHVHAPEQPAFLQHNSFRGKAYRLDEPVLDITSVLTTLRRLDSGSIIKIDSDARIEFCSAYNEPAARIRIHEADAGEIELQARCIILTAGMGNEVIESLVPKRIIRTQRRPLHMIMARGRIEDPIYSHFLGMSAVPRATITTHPTESGDHVLYIGGQAAEDGVPYPPIEQIRSTRRLLRELMPDFPVDSLKWATCRIDRAEPLQPGGRRPDSSFATRIGHLVAAWPTKLALAPQLTTEILMLLEADPALILLNRDAPVDAVRDEQADSNPAWLEPFRDWPRPSVASPPWEECTEWIDVS